MANFVSNRIKLFGNKHIDDLVAEIQKRIRADINKTNEREDLSLVERIFYGRDHSDIKWSYENIGSKWIYPSMDGVDDELVFITGGEPALGFQDHILKCASKVDPKVIVRLQYDDEMPNFVGARYVLIDKILSRMNKLKNNRTEQFQDTFNFNIREISGKMKLHMDYPSI